MIKALGFPKIRESIKEKGYELISPSPQSLGGNTHFTVAFIIKKESMEENTRPIVYSKNTVLEKYECNRIMALDFKVNDVELTIINMHLPNKKLMFKEIDVREILNEIDREITKEDKKVILLGDFNAFTEEQNEKGKVANYREYVDRFIKGHDKDPKYTECGDNKQYTYYTSSGGSKLDHIFVSNSIIDSGLCEKEPPLEIDDTVNFHVVKDKQKIGYEAGFTNHSMLTLHLMV